MNVEVYIEMHSSLLITVPSLSPSCLHFHKALPGLFPLTSPSFAHILFSLEDGRVEEIRDWPPPASDQELYPSWGWT